MSELYPAAQSIVDDGVACERKVCLLADHSMDDLEFEVRSDLGLTTFDLESVFFMVVKKCLVSRIGIHFYSN